MSQAHMEIIRSLYAKTEHGDFGFLDREPELRGFFVSDVEWHTREDLPDAGIRRGYEGLAHLRAEWAEAFDDFHLDLDELIDAGDHVVAVARICGCLRGSRHPVEVEETQVWKMREGRATEVRAYLTRTEALKAVGLESRAVSQENVEIVRRLLEACNHRDFDAMLETGDPEIEVVTLMSGTHRGHTAWRQLVEEMTDEVSAFQFVLQDLIDAGQERVVAVTGWVGTGRTSGIAIPDTTIGLVYTLRGGLVVRQESFRSKADALIAVGLGE